MQSLIGQSLGRYHILEQLGEGGMAIVYKAHDTRLETDVAVKVIRTENLAPSVLERSLKRFEREAKALARLTHPNIVKVMDYGDYQNRPYLVMEYLPGGTLKKRLGHPIPWKEALQILLPIARALDFAHRQNMIHRDVKPSNILVTADGEPMLTDFGIAKIIDEEATVDLTGTSAAVGTPEYMAPEQATAKNVDQRADIYAMGIVLYEMLTGRRPFVADTPMAVLIKHATEPLPRPGQFAPDLPGAVEKMLIKALSKNPEERFQSMGEMAMAWQALLRNNESPPFPVEGSNSYKGQVKSEKIAKNLVRQTAGAADDDITEAASFPDSSKDGADLPPAAQWVSDDDLAKNDLAYTEIKLSTLFRRRSVMGAKFSPDYDFIAVAADNGISCHDAETLSERWFWKSNSLPTSIVVSPRNNAIFVGTESGMIHLLWPSGKEARSAHVHDYAVYGLSVSSSGELIASASEDGAIGILSDKIALLRRLEWHTEAVSDVSISADGSYLIAGSSDRYASIWDVASGELIEKKKFKSGVVSIAIALDDDMIAIGTESGVINLWHRKTNRVRELDYHSDWVNSLSFSPNGSLLAASSEDKDICLWQPHTGKLKKVLPGHLECVVSVDFSPDGEELLSGSFDGTCRLWEIPKAWLNTDKKLLR